MKFITILGCGVPSIFGQLLTYPFVPLPTQELLRPQSLYELGSGTLVFTPVDPHICDGSVKQHAGYFEIDGTNKKYFFWFFESRADPETSPTVAWLTGGPGCSSLLALFGENGPCSVDKDGSSTKSNLFSWNDRANMFWIDQPPGTGFSEGDSDVGETEVASDMIGFLQAFFEALPEYNKDFYIFGESYAGHYIPAIASMINENNKANRGFYIDFKGIGIGNGLTSPEEQYKWYPDMAYKSGTAPSVVTDAEYQAMMAAVAPCIETIKMCNAFDGQNPFCFAAIVVCNMGLMKPYQDHGLNPYDMRLKCEKPPLCYDFSQIDAFLNNPDIQKKLGVKKQWEGCNYMVNLQFVFDFMKNYDQLIPQLLHDGIRVLIYVGDKDFICNWIGNKKWVLNLEWQGKQKFNEAGDVLYKDDNGEEIGLLRTSGGLSFLQFYDAGHMIPMDQPSKSLFMFNDFIMGKKLTDELTNVFVE
jgi:carboxypeptidase C (cathepsin A)